ncbi:MAG: ornithine cyclodeaminase family protein [Chromatiales bacterium]|nr:ornithine cyclodeaminase family protein [Chromatiales bacterium]
MHDAPLPPLRYLSRADVEACAPAASAMADAIEQAISAREHGEAWSLPKASVVPRPGALYQAMLSASRPLGAAAIKCVGLAAENGARGWPHIGTLIVVHDGESGLPLAVMDGGWITGARTAALTVVAARRLARPDAAVLTLVGAGEQGRAHLDALAEAFPLREVRVVSRGGESARALASRARARGLAADALPDAGAALEGADLVVSSVPATAGLQPFLDPAQASAGAFLSLVDVARSWHRAGFARFDRVLVDDAEQDRASGAPMLDPDCVDGDLGDLLAGRVSSRASAAERAVFVCRGVALADLAAATLVHRAAEARGLGIVLPR